MPPVGVALTVTVGPPLDDALDDVDPVDVPVRGADVFDVGAEPPDDPDVVVMGGGVEVFVGVVDPEVPPEVVPAVVPEVDVPDVVVPDVVVPDVVVPELVGLQDPTA